MVFLSGQNIEIVNRTWVFARLRQAIGFIEESLAEGNTATGKAKQSRQGTKKHRSPQRIKLKIK